MGILEMDLERYFDAPFFIVYSISLRPYHAVYYNFEMGNMVARNFDPLQKKSKAWGGYKA